MGCVVSNLDTLCPVLSIDVIEHCLCHSDNLHAYCVVIEGEAVGKTTSGISMDGRGSCLNIDIFST